MTEESVLAAPEKWKRRGRAPAWRTCFLQIQFRRRNEKVFPMVFIGRASSARGVTKRLGWGGVFSVLESVSWDLRRLRPLLRHQRPRPG